MGKIINKFQFLEIKKINVILLIVLIKINYKNEYKENDYLLQMKIKVFKNLVHH